MSTPKSGITSQTASNLLLDAGVVYVNYGLAGERMVGVTEGGNTYNNEREIRDIPADGSKGKVKGLRRVISDNATLTVNMKEVTKDNLMLAISGSEVTGTPTTDTITEFLGEGADATEESFTFSEAPINDDNIIFYVNGLEVDWTKGEEYTVDNLTLNIIGTDTLSAGDELVASYAYDTGTGDTHDEIRSRGDIENGDYFDNIAFVGNLSGSSEPVVIVLENALSDGNIEVNATDQEEGVIPVEMSSHYDPDNMDKVPHAVRYPKAG